MGPETVKIGYPCMNHTLEPEVRTSRTFRLASFTPERFRETVRLNLDGLRRILEWNVREGVGFFRISSDLVPFASHPVCRIPWWDECGPELAAMGAIVRDGGLRISMHPDQFTLLNSPDAEIVRRIVDELAYHVRVLDAIGLDATAKVQIHVGGVYGDRPAAMRRFAAAYRNLPAEIRARLVIENDDRQYPVADCVALHEDLGVPVLFDFFHHRLLNRGEPSRQGLEAAMRTWRPHDGIPMTDYSSQEPGARRGAHARTLDAGDFRATLAETRPLDFDIMLEIKDKELSARRAMALLSAAARPPNP